MNRKAIGRVREFFLFIVVVIAVAFSIFYHYILSLSKPL